MPREASTAVSNPEKPIVNGQKYRKVPGIQIDLKAFDHRPLDEATREISETVNRTGGHIRGVVRLPNRRQNFTVNRSPHVDKKSREQFVMITHSWMVQIASPSTRTIDALMRLDLDPSVKVEIDMDVMVKVDIHYADAAE